MLNQDTGWGLGNKTSWLPLSLPFNEINISCYILSCDICFGPTPKKHLSSSPGRSILVLRGFRCIAGKLNTWRNLFVPWIHDKIHDILEEMASLSLQAELGFYRLPPFCSSESPIPHLSYPPVISESGLHQDTPLWLLSDNEEPALQHWPSVSTGLPTHSAKFWVSEMVRGEKFGPSCLPDLASSY